MEAKTIPPTLPFAQAALPAMDDDASFGPRLVRASPAGADADDDFEWVYDDPDLAPFRAGTSRRRPETPLTAFA